MNKPERAGKTDGRLFRATMDDLEPGSVLRTVSEDGTAAPFSDFVVVAHYGVDRRGERVRAHQSPSLVAGRELVLARPYLYATLTHTACPSWLTGVEELRVDVKSVLKEDSIFRVVCTARGSLHGYVK